MENFKTVTPDEERPHIPYEKREFAPQTATYLFNKVGVVKDL